MFWGIYGCKCVYMYAYMCWTTAIIQKYNYKEMQLQNIKNEKMEIPMWKKKKLHFPSVQNLKRNVTTFNKIFVEQGSIEKSWKVICYLIYIQTLWKLLRSQVLHISYILNNNNGVHSSHTMHFWSTICVSKLQMAHFSPSQTHYPRSLNNFFISKSNYFAISVFIIFLMHGQIRGISIK